MYSPDDFISTKYSLSVQNGVYTCSSPSNIALVKYWGKKENILAVDQIDSQIPANPSLSFTLNNCKTITELSFIKKQSTDSLSFELLFEGQSKEDFKPKIQQFFERTLIYLPFLKDYHFVIDTKNTFPHSSGIASSASGMAALTMCLMNIEKALNPSMSEDYFLAKSSFLARLGSGSACRSISGQVVVWGQHNAVFNSSDWFGVAYSGSVHKNFQNFQDTILLVDKGEKQVSSTLGHNLMEGHPFASQRFYQANHNLSQLISILQSGDLDQFISIVESEALTLHSMMMTSIPYFILMKPNTLQIINAIWKYRAETKIPICFTLDAGANVHVLYPEIVKEQVMNFIKNDLVVYCQNGAYICDSLGTGSSLIN